MAEGVREVREETLFFECNLQLFSCTTMMRKLITHWSGFLFLSSLSSLTHKESWRGKEGGKEGRDIGEGILDWY